ILAGPVAARRRPRQHGLDALANAGRRLRLRRPYRFEHLHDMPDLDARDGQLADDRARVELERRDPVLPMLRVAELVDLRPMALLRGLVERQCLRLMRSERRLALLTGRNGVDALPQRFAQLSRPHARCIEPDVRVAAEADLVPAVADLQSENPATRARILDVQAQTRDAADSVQARPLEAPHLER